MYFKKEKKYSCGYCEYSFVATAKARISNGGRTTSNQIKCPKCGNFLKTWEDEVERQLAQ